MRIGIIGTGNVAIALGDRFRQNGHAVVYGSRKPVDGRSVDHADAVRQSDLVIIAIPGAAVIPALEAIGADILANKIVIDLSAPISAEMTLLYPNDSLARIIQERFPNITLVKTLNTMNVSMMIDPVVENPTVFLSGDDAAAKETVAGLLGELGWRRAHIFDLGGIDTAIGTEHAVYLFFAAFTALQTPAFTISIGR